MGIPHNWNYLVPKAPKKITLNEFKDAMVKELKNQAATYRYSCLDVIMAKLKW